MELRIKDALQEQADLELGKRAKTGAVMYFLGFMVVLAVTPFGQDYPRLSIFLAAFFFLLGCMRLYWTIARKKLYAFNKVLWKRVCYALILTVGGVWGCFCAGVLAVYGISPLSFLVTLMTASVSAGSFTTLHTHIALLRAYLILLLVPIAIAALSLVNEFSYTLAFLIILEYIFLDVQGRIHSRVYWDSITDNLLLKEHEKELVVAREAAESASRSKSEFLAGLSHEIRTPMNAILGMADVLSNSPLDETSRNYLGIIRRAGKSLLNLINDILDLSKIESGRLELEALCFDFGELVQKTAELMLVSAHEKGLILNCVVMPDIPEVVGDPYRLRQIITNLISNAVKFTEKGEIVVRAKKVAVAGNEIVLGCEIADTGIGIPTNKLDAIFESFTQADASTTRKYGGSGLGLTIAQKLASMMGGEIRVRSEVGKGSVFSLLVKMQIAEGKTAEHVSDGKKILEKIKLAEPLEILLVEDNEENQAVIRSYLDGTPFRLEIARNGAEGVEKFKAKHFDIVLMDIRMPVMNGYDATQAMRRWESEQPRTDAGTPAPSVPILALTASVFDEEVKQIAESGCTAHLMKPVLRDQLLEAILRYSRAS